MNKRLLLAGLLLVLFGPNLSSDELILNDGTKKYGHVEEWTNDGVIFNDNGKIEDFRQEEIQTVNTHLSPSEEFRRRKKYVKNQKNSQTIDLLTICKWGKQQGLKEELIPTLSNLTRHEQTQEEARSMLNAIGYKKYNDRWVPKEVFYKKSGYVYYQGKWMPREKKERLVKRARVRAYYNDQMKEIKRKKKRIKQQKERLQNKIMETNVDMREADAALKTAKEIRTKINNGFTKIERTLDSVEPKFSGVRSGFRSAKGKVKKRIKQEKKVNRGKEKLIKKVKKGFKKKFGENLDVSKSDLSSLKKIDYDKTLKMMSILREIKKDEVPAENPNGVEDIVNKKIDNLKTMSEHLEQMKKKIKKAKNSVERRVNRGRKILKKLQKNREKAHQEGDWLTELGMTLAIRTAKNKLSKGVRGINALEGGIEKLKNGKQILEDGKSDLQKARKKLNLVIDNRDKLQDGLKELKNPVKTKISVKTQKIIPNQKPGEPYTIKMGTQKVEVKKDLYRKLISKVRDPELHAKFANANSFQEVYQTFDKMQDSLLTRIAKGLNKAYRKRRELHDKMKKVKKKITLKKEQKTFSTSFQDVLQMERKEIRRGKCIQKKMLRPRKDHLRLWKDRATFILNHPRTEPLPKKNVPDLPSATEIDLRSKKDLQNKEVEVHGLFLTDRDKSNQFVVLVKQKMTQPAMNDRNNPEDSLQSGKNPQKPKKQKGKNKNNQKTKYRLMPVVVSGSKKPARTRTGSELKIKGTISGTTNPTDGMKGVKINAEDTSLQKPEIPTFSEAFVQCRRNN